jgi:hypothetical protein
MKAYNAGSIVERNGKIVESKEEIPPYALVVIGQAGQEAASFDSAGKAVWYVSKPGPAAPLYRPEMLAVNGPTPIPYQGHGEVSQDWPQRVAVPLVDGVVPVHGTYGPKSGSWLAHPYGGVFTCQGLDTVTAQELGAKQTPTGKWSNLPKTGLAWITPRLTDHPWATGWDQGQLLAKKSVWDPSAEVSDAVAFRLQQPQEALAQSEAIDRIGWAYEPINDRKVHMPTDAEKGLPIRDAVGWFKVREAGDYFVTFSSKLDVNGYWSANGSWSGAGAYIGLGLFAAKPTKVPDKFEAWRQPVTMATRQPVRIIYQMDIISGQGWYENKPTYSPIEGDYYGDSEDDIFSSEENVCASAIMPLDAGWALGVMKIGLDAMRVEHFNITIYRLGPPSDLETYWKIHDSENARKVFWPADEEVS